MSYTNWHDVPLVQVHAWSMWASASDVAWILFRLRSVQFTVAEKRIQAFQALDSLYASKIVGPSTRFPDGDYMLNLDDPALAVIINRMRSDLDYQNALEAAAKCGDLTAKEAMQLYNERVTSFCENLNALQTYIFSPKNAWNRVKYEKNYALKWMP